MPSSQSIHDKYSRKHSIIEIFDNWAIIAKVDKGLLKFMLAIHQDTHTEAQLIVTGKNILVRELTELPPVDVFEYIFA